MPARAGTKGAPSGGFSDSDRPPGGGRAGSKKGLLARLQAAGRWIIAPVRPWLRALRHLPDRVMHDRRRGEAEERVRTGGPFESIVVLCVGNVCRSPYAEKILRERLATDDRGPRTVASAGFSGWDRKSPSHAVAEAAERGVDLTGHRSVVVTNELVDTTDLFLVTDVRQSRRLRRSHGVEKERILHLGDLDPEPIDMRTIEDPWGKERRVFRESYDRIERCLDRFLALLEQSRGGAVAESAGSEPAAEGEAPAGNEPRAGTGPGAGG